MNKQDKAFHYKPTFCLLKKIKKILKNCNEIDTSASLK